VKLRAIVVAALAVPGLALAVAAPAGAATHHPTVGISASRYSIHPGTTVTLSGTVFPNLHGRSIAVQRYANHSWHKVSTRKLSATSRYKVSVSPSYPGTWIYRVHFLAQAGWSSANSRNVSIKVIRKAPTAPPAASCYPLTNGGNCYEPGEFCRSTDHGVTGVAGDGEAIECEDNNGWRWEPI